MSKKNLRIVYEQTKTQGSFENSPLATGALIAAHVPSRLAWHGTPAASGARDMQDFRAGCIDVSESGLQSVGGCAAANLR